MLFGVDGWFSRPYEQMQEFVPNCIRSVGPSLNIVRKAEAGSPIRGLRSPKMQRGFRELAASLPVPPLKLLGFAVSGGVCHSR